MNKRVFYQNSPLFYLNILVLLAIIGIGISVVIVLLMGYLSWRDFWFWLSLIAAIGTIAFFIPEVIHVARNRIILLADKIIVPANKGERKIQHKVEMQYVDIKRIYLVASNKDSNGKSVFGVFVLMPYIIFEEYDGSQKAVNVYYYSKKRVANIIDLTVERAKKQGGELGGKSGSELIKDFINSMKK